MNCQSLSADTGALCLANVNVLNLNYQKIGWELMKDGTEDFVQVREFEITCDSPMFPH